MAAENSQFMCHEPSFSKVIQPTQVQMVQSVNSEDCDRDAHRLRELKHLLYSEAERCLFERQRFVGDDLVTWRRRWEKINRKNNATVAFIQSIRKYDLPDPPKYHPKKTDVFDYLVAMCAMDTRTQWISAKWMWRLNLVNAVGVDIHIKTRETLSIQQVPGFESRLSWS